MNISTMVNVASHLPVQAERQPDALAAAFPVGRDSHGKTQYLRWTYRKLNNESDSLARGLKKIGIGRGVRTVLMVKPSLEFFALTFALFKVGAVPVLVDPGMGVKNLGQCLAEAEPEAFVGITKAHLARKLLGWGKRTIRTLVTVGPRLLWGGWKLDQVRNLGHGTTHTSFADTQAEDTAAILFTSGSTGPPKGAVYTHGIFAAQVELLRTTYDIQPGEIDLCTFPLFALFAPALGMSAIIPDMDATRPGEVDPRNVIEPIQSLGVTNLFGSPALLRRVGEYGASRQEKLPSLRRVISAGAPVAADVLETFTTMLAPGVRIFTPYGATEALPVCSIGSDEILGETRKRTEEGAGVCVGRPVDGITVRIIGKSDEPIPAWSDDLLVAQGEIGEVVVQGPMVTSQYYNRAEATKLSKIWDESAHTYWHRMGDVGWFDETGRLWFCGRKAHRVLASHGVMYTVPCEAVFNTHPQVLRTALVGVGPPGAARPVICVELMLGVWASRQQVKDELIRIGQQFDHTRMIDTFLFHPRFPVDIRHNAKINREELSRWAAGQLA